MQQEVSGHSREQPTNPEILYLALCGKNMPKPKLNAGFRKEKIVMLER